MKIFFGFKTTVKLFKAFQKTLINDFKLAFKTQNWKLNFLDTGPKTEIRKFRF